MKARRRCGWTVILPEKGQKKLRKFTGGGNNCIVL
jgi:L-aminopeptidase/D-esterase-like protein